jgi:hypothetical protein
MHQGRQDAGSQKESIMFLDALGLVAGSQAAGQAFGAGAVSTNSIDLGATSVSPNARQIGTGEPIGFGFEISVDATVAATTVEIISATDAALTAGIISHAQITIPLAAALAGSVWFIPLPPGTPTQRFLGIRTATAGGTISGRAWLTLQSMFSILTKAYPKSYAV